VGRPRLRCVDAVESDLRTVRVEKVEVFSKGQRRMEANSEGGQSPAWAVELQVMLMTIMI
jgi:hypothetical protein